MDIIISFVAGLVLFILIPCTPGIYLAHVAPTGQTFRLYGRIRRLFSTILLALLSFVAAIIIVTGIQAELVYQTIPVFHRISGISFEYPPNVGHFGIVKEYWLRAIYSSIKSGCMSDQQAICALADEHFHPVSGLWHLFVGCVAVSIHLWQRRRLVAAKQDKKLSLKE